MSAARRIPRRAARTRAHDHQRRGDVLALTDAAGETFAAYACNPYGDPSPATLLATQRVSLAEARALSAANLLRFAGYVYDQATGMYYLSKRYYDPETCSFITKDPAEADGQKSAYAYCGGDPVGMVDPGREHPIAVIFVAAVIIGPFAWYSVKAVRRAEARRRQAVTEIDVLDVQTRNRTELKRATLVATVPVATYGYASWTGVSEPLGRAINKAVRKAKGWVARWQTRHKSN